MRRKSLVGITLIAIAALMLPACAPAETATPAPTLPAAAPTTAPVGPTLPAAEPTGAPTAGAQTGAIGTVRVATDATWPPFEIVDETTKEIVGFDIDLLNAIAAKAGFEVEYINVGFDPLLAGMAQCQYDAAISAMTITEERKQQMLFSDPYFAAGQVITVSKDDTTINGVDDLTGKNVGAQIGTTGAIEAEKIQGVNLRSYDTVDLAFQDLMNGQIDAVIADNPLALGFVGKNPDRLKTVGDVFTEENYGIAVCNQKPEILAKINEGLAAVKADGTIEELTTKWLSTQ
jgi:polar amino acid transport system substrate-binding protein